MPFASRTGRPRRGACLGLVGVLAVGAPLLAQPPGTEGLRDEVEAQFRVIATSGGIGLLPRDDDGGVALIELRGEAVYIDGDGPLSVQGLTDALGGAAAPLLRLRRLDVGRQRSVLGLPPVAGVAADDAPEAADALGVAADTPAENAGAPAADTGASAADTGALAADTGGAPAADTGAPAADTGALAADTGAPAADTGAPAADTGAARVADTGAPAADTGAPAADTGAGAAAAPVAVAVAAAAGRDGAAEDADDDAPPRIAPPASGAASADPAPRRRTVRGDIVRFGGYVHVPADERLNGDVVLIGGRLRVDGEVTRDIVVIGGSAEFGPGAVVRRDVTVVGGRVTRHPDARFERALNEVGFGGLDLNLGDFGNGFWWPRPSPFYSSSSDLMETFIRFAFLGLLGSVVLLVASGSARRVADRVTREPVKAGVVGFCAQLLFLPLLIIGSVLLVITLIGIPLLALMPLVVVAALVVLLLGFTGVVQLVSRLFARGQRSDLVLFWVGLVLLMAPALFGDALDLVGGPFRFFAVILGVTGFLVEYLAWTAGSGAVILNWFGGDPTAAAGPPPPIPPPASPPSPLPPSASPA